MRMLLPAFVVIISLSGCGTSKLARVMIKQGIVGYSSQYTQNSAPYKFNIAGAFLNEKSEIVWFNAPIAQFETIETLDPVIVNGDTSYQRRRVRKWPLSERPFSYKKRGKNIYIKYHAEGKVYESVQYSLDRRDTTAVLNFQQLCNKHAYERRPGKGHYRTDSTINYLGYKFKCLVFDEFYDQGMRTAPLVKIVTYLEKKTLFPIRMEYTLHPEKTYASTTEGTTITVLSFFLTDSNAVTMKKLILPKCN